jgi:CxxC motif-containing protein
MDVVMKDSEVVSVEGNQCKKGPKYAQKEMTFPGRVLTTTVNTGLQEIPLLPVRSNGEIPKDRLMDCMVEIAGHHIKGEVQMGETVIRDILGLGVDIVACRTIPCAFR